MKRRQVHHTSTSTDFHAALFVVEYPRPSIDVCTIGNSPILHTNFAQPPLSVKLWVSKLSKSCQNFLNLLVKEKELWQVNVLSPSMPLYGTLSLFRTSFACCYVFLRTCAKKKNIIIWSKFLTRSAVTSALASPILWWKCLARKGAKFIANFSVLARNDAKFIAKFSATNVTSLPSHSLCISLSAPRAPHTQYRKRFRASYN